jgi:hypothetical protein
MRVMLDIGVVVGSSPTVIRPADAQHVVFVLEGLREARSGDRLTRLRLTLPAAHARHLAEQLAGLDSTPV